jgi:hypothetical protein
MLRKYKDDTPAPKLNKINGSKRSIARNRRNKKAIEQPEFSFNIGTVNLTQNFPDITEALYPPTLASQETDAVSDTSSLAGLPQENDQMVEFHALKLENFSQYSYLESIQSTDQQINDINIWPPSVFPAYTHLTTVVVKDTVIPDTSSTNPVNPDYFGLVDFSRL